MGGTNINNTTHTHKNTNANHHNLTSHRLRTTSPLDKAYRSKLQWLRPSRLHHQHFAVADAAGAGSADDEVGDVVGGFVSAFIRLSFQHGITLPQPWQVDLIAFAV